MKKVMASLALITTLFACQSNSGGFKIPENANGYNIDSTANTEIILKTVKAMEAMDTVAYRSYYAPNAIFHDNLDTINLDQNIQMISTFKAAGVGVKITSTAPIWELVNKKPSSTGVTNYVISFQFAEFTKGDKTVKVVMNLVDAFKDGKIVEEWGIYDTKNVYELLK